MRLAVLPDRFLECYAASPLQNADYERKIDR